VWLFIGGYRGWLVFVSVGTVASRQSSVSSVFRLDAA
jgi:hypothetical protein